MGKARMKDKDSVRMSKVPVLGKKGRKSHKKQKDRTKVEAGSREDTVTEREVPGTPDTRKTEGKKKRAVVKQQRRNEGDYSGLKHESRRESGRMDGKTGQKRPAPAQAEPPEQENASEKLPNSPKKKQRELKSICKRGDVELDGQVEHVDGDNVKGAATRNLRTAEARRAERKARKLMKIAQAEAQEAESDPEPGVIYIGHIPHGFYEKEMKGFFSQFGTVTRVRLSRSRKTARSKGFAYVEFSNAHVAKIAADAMNGYLIFGRALVAQFVPPERLHKDALKGANRKFRRLDFSAAEGLRLVKNGRDPLKIRKRAKRLLSNRAKKRARLEQMGISYNFPSLHIAREEGAKEQGTREREGEGMIT